MGTGGQGGFGGIEGLEAEAMVVVGGKQKPPAYQIRAHPRTHAPARTLHAQEYSTPPRCLSSFWKTFPSPPIVSRDPLRADHRRTLPHPLDSRPSALPLCPSQAPSAPYPTDPPPSPRRPPSSAPVHPLSSQTVHGMGDTLRHHPLLHTLKSTPLPATPKPPNSREENRPPLSRPNRAVRGQKAARSVSGQWGSWARGRVIVSEIRR